MKPLDERKLEYVCPVEGTIARTPTTITKSISRFLAQSRNRNDASNRAEFLKSISEKRGATVPNTVGAEQPLPPSCARADAKTLDRDVQMKYDIAKNEDGPLKRTMRNNANQEHTGKGKRKASVLDEINGEVTAERHSGLAERFTNIESHLAVRYVPSPPHSLLDRIRFLEDHIMELEKSHPPWSALHFNQPNRGWPPPPRTTPIIIPSHLTSHREPNTDNTGQKLTLLADQGKAQARGKGRAAGTSSRAKSSLHRAVMERLEVKKAMDDLAGVSEEPG
ncbi:hypothetical protein BD410DRAFT_716677 [Rickenella mellea]|uniref:Uncharacterized protein n=1 Tax=Rickenella mellea TaxID=50990 RepID=A0A4Y7QFA3_9AGAM|nr:hypothetical protein BD410DRAFT_716677 [Rickenella mellea]